MKGIIYNIPGKASIEINCNNKTLYKGEEQVVQFGSFARTAFSSLHARRQESPKLKYYLS